MLKEKIEGLQKLIKEKRAAYNVDLEQAKTAANEGNLEKAKELKEKIEKLMSEVEAAEKELKELNEISKLEELKSYDSKEERKRGNGKVLIDPKATENEEVQSFENFVRSRGAETRGLTTENGSVLVPKDISMKIFEPKRAINSLSNRIVTQPVSNKSGSFPIAKRNEVILKTKEELKEMEDIEADLVTNVEWNIETRAGKIILSNEMLDDTGINLMDFIKKQLDLIVLNTDNYNILNLIKTAFSKKTIGNLSELKTICNVELDPAFLLTIDTNQSGYNYLDTLKDEKGNYILQPSITATSGKSLFGHDLIVHSDKFLKNGGTKDKPKYPIIVGDLEEGIIQFVRKRVDVTWEKFDSYSSGLGVVVRNDYKEIDKESIYFVELDESLVV